MKSCFKLMYLSCLHLGRLDNTTRSLLLQTRKANMTARMPTHFIYICRRIMKPNSSKVLLNIMQDKDVQEKLKASARGIWTP